MPIPPASTEPWHLVQRILVPGLISSRCRKYYKGAMKDAVEGFVSGFGIYLGFHIERSADCLGNCISYGHLSGI